MIEVMHYIGGNHILNKYKDLCLDLLHCHDLAFKDQR